MHATNSLTGNWKPGGRESHPHQLPLREAVNSNRVIFDSTTWFYETKKSWTNFDISVIPKNAIRNSTSHSLSLIAKGMPSNPPTNLIASPNLKFPHNITWYPSIRRKFPRYLRILDLDIRGLLPTSAVNVHP